jgi:uncharacterized protein (DUF983 family)
MEPRSPHSIDSPYTARRSQPFVVLLYRAARLRCPACGQARIFRGWFAMNESCPACGRRFQRDAGYFLGSIYFNYAVTGLLVVVMYFAMYFGDVLTNEQRLGVLAVFVVVFPAWFFRYARALWMAADEYLDPWPNEDEARRMAAGSTVQGAGSENR